MTVDFVKDFYLKNPYCDRAVKSALQGAALVPKVAGRGKHHKKRDSKPLVGMMIHQDASTHSWVPGAYPAKRNTRPMLGFKSFQAACNVLAGIELMHMICKGQMAMLGCEGLSFADQFYAQARQVRPA
jgi:hypothetical protein